jgi:hypothetical protein
MAHSGRISTSDTGRNRSAGSLPSERQLLGSCRFGRTQRCGVRINMARPSRPGEDARQCSTALGCEHKTLGLLLNEPCRLKALDGNPVQPAVKFTFSDKL